MGCIRGFTLIPVSYLIPFGLLFLSPAVHFLLTIGGILVSSAFLYYFSERLQLAEYFETRHASHVARIRGLLRRQELPIVIGWSFFPLAPTDLICYVCGSLGVGVRKMLLGILVGEGIIFAAKCIQLIDHSGQPDLDRLQSHFEFDNHPPDKRAEVTYKRVSPTQLERPWRDECRAE